MEHCSSKSRSALPSSDLLISGLIVDIQIISVLLYVLVELAVRFYEVT